MTEDLARSLRAEPGIADVLIADLGIDVFVAVVPADYCSPVGIRLRCAELVPDRTFVVAIVDDLPGAGCSSGAELNEVVQELAEAPTASRSTPPSGPLEESMLVIWREVLELEGLGVTDDFLDLDCDSFDALELICSVEERLGRVVDVETFFAQGTIRAIAAILADQE